MSELKTDPLRDVRIEEFKAHVKKVFALCKKHYGMSKYQSEYPDLVFDLSGEDIMGGYYCHDTNEMQINYQGFDDSKECSEYYTKLVTHEWIHFLQSPVWFKRYYSQYGHDYISHPYEREAYGREDELLELVA